MHEQYDQLGWFCGKLLRGNLEHSGAWGGDQ